MRDGGGARGAGVKAEKKGALMEEGGDLIALERETERFNERQRVERERLCNSILIEKRAEINGMH